MKAKVIIVLFFARLLLLAIFEMALIWLFANYIGSPLFVYGSINVILGLLSIGLGSLLLLWSFWIQFADGQGTPTPKAATQKLVTSGPYTYTRNPMTLGAAVLYLGISIWFGSLIVFFLVLLVFTALLIFIHVHETEELSNRFGAEYLAYKEKSPFLILCPWLKKRL